MWSYTAFLITECVTTSVTRELRCLCLNMGHRREDVWPSMAGGDVMMAIKSDERHKFWP